MDEIRPAMSKAAKRPLIKWVFVTAVAAVCLIAAVLFIQNRVHPINNHPNLPKLTVNTGDAGYRDNGFFAYDVSELYNGNPWNENAVIKALPVFQNPKVYDKYWNLIGGLTRDEMIEKGRQKAAALGLTVDEVLTDRSYISRLMIYNRHGELANCNEVAITVKPDDYTIIVWPDGTIGLSFENGIPMPDEYRFTNEYETEQEAKDAVLYLLSQYPAAVDMKNPALDVFGANPPFPQRHFCLNAYENKGNILERIVGYNFDRVEFLMADNMLLEIRRHYGDINISQKIGDYPIITPDEARMLLLQNHYVIQSPYDMPGEEYIAHVELVYRTNIQNQVFMPYYRFWAELPKRQREDGLKEFGEYFVPAVKAEYLENMPLWNGSKTEDEPPGFTEIGADKLKWPSRLPYELPEYTDGEIKNVFFTKHQYSEATDERDFEAGGINGVFPNADNTITIEIYDTSIPAYEKYLDTLIKAGWKQNDIYEEYNNAYEFSQENCRLTVLQFSDGTLRIDMSFPDTSELNYHYFPY